jgi:hypothetical protein
MLHDNGYGLRHAGGYYIRISNADSGLRNLCCTDYKCCSGNRELPGIGKGSPIFRYAGNGAGDKTGADIASLRIEGSSRRQ